MDIGDFLWMLGASIIGILTGLCWDNWGWRSDPEGSIKILKRIQAKQVLKKQHKLELKDLDG